MIDARLSEDEIALNEAALTYALDSAGCRRIEQRFGASTDEIEGMRDDLRDAQRKTKQATSGCLAQ